jgi:hypothetical protein
MAQIDDIINGLQQKLSDARSAVQRHKTEIDKHLKLAEEIEVTLRTLQAHGVVGGPAKPVAESSRPKGFVPANGKYTVPEMITMALGSDKFAAVGAEPLDVIQYIRDNIDSEADPNHVRPALWRMEKTGRLAKNRGRYKLPMKNEALDPQSAEAEGSKGSIRDPEAHGVKAAPGGGI